MADGHGGAREGAGRKKKTVQFERQIARAEKKIADKLPKIIDELLRLALGEVEITEERCQLAITVTVKDVEFCDDGRGGRRGIAVERQLFPNADPEQLVLVETKKKNLGPDREAIKYAVDRILGKPFVEEEPEEDAHEDELPHEVEEGLDKAYGDEEESRDEVS